MTRILTFFLDLVAFYTMLIEYPLIWALDELGYPTEREEWFLVYDIVATVILLMFLIRFYNWLIDFPGRMRGRRSNLIDDLGRG